MMRRVRVGFDARWYNDSGVGTYVAELLRAMADNQQEIEMVVYEDPRNRVPGLEDLDVYRVNVRSAKYSFSAQWELRRRAHEDRLDLFHSPFYAAPMALGCPLIVTVHDLIPFLFRICHWPKQQVIKAGYFLTSCRAAHFIADSKSTARDLMRILKVQHSRIAVIPLAPREMFQPLASEGELDQLRARYGIHPPYVMLLSARNWRTKNLESALRALEIARCQADMDFQVVVCGCGEGLNAVPPGTRRTLNLVETGYLGANELAACFRHAHLFLMTSLYEGFGLPLVEAMASGCPVVCSNAGSLEEIARGGAQVFDPFDVAGMGAAAARLLLVEEERARWGKAALERSRDFSWKTTAAQTISTYHQVLDGRLTAMAAVEA